MMVLLRWYLLSGRRTLAPCGQHMDGEHGTLVLWLPLHPSPAALPLLGLAALYAGAISVLDDPSVSAMCPLQARPPLACGPSASAGAPCIEPRAAMDRPGVPLTRFRPIPQPASGVPRGPGAPAAAKGPQRRTCMLPELPTTI
jgi:hypothetical protein